MYPEIKTNANTFNEYIEFIRENYGICFEEINTPILENKIHESLKRTNIATPEEYLTLLKNDLTELTRFVDSITNNLTFFFRNDIHFAIFSHAVLPQIIARNKDSKKIKIWSAGCSTGEEPYSIAMAILRHLGYKAVDWEINIVATDISLKAISTAVEGIYLKRKVSNIDPYYIEHYMKEEKNYYKIKKEVKKLVSFDYRNLLEETAEKKMHEFDTIFCRNVIIYFNRETQERVLEIFYRALKKDSYIFLGHSESIRGLNTSFVSKKIDSNYLYYKE